MSHNVFRMVYVVCIRAYIMFIFFKCLDHVCELRLTHIHEYGLCLDS